MLKVMLYYQLGWRWLPHDIALTKLSQGLLSRWYRGIRLAIKAVIVIDFRHHLHSMVLNIRRGSSDPRNSTPHTQLIWAIGQKRAILATSSYDGADGPGPWVLLLRKLQLGLARGWARRCWYRLSERQLSLAWLGKSRVGDGICHHRLLFLICWCYLSKRIVSHLLCLLIYPIQIFRNLHKNRLQTRC